MSKISCKLHCILFSANIIVLVASLVFYLIKWHELPAEIGMHFDSDGNYDVIASKLYGFYPHLIGGSIISGFAFADHLIVKKHSGLQISETGEMLFKSGLLLTLDFFALMWSIYFSLWSYAVSLQQPLNTRLIGCILSVLSVPVLVGIIILLIIVQKYKIKNVNSTVTELMRRMCRLTAWLLTGSGICIMIACWGRYPTDPAYFFDPAYQGLAYFANFDSYLDKRLLLIPHALIIILLILLELISAKAVMADRRRLILLTDKFKLICGVFFFWWNLMLDSENRIGIVSVGMFVSICAALFATYAIQCSKRKDIAKSDSPAPQDTI